MSYTGLEIYHNISELSLKHDKPQFNVISPETGLTNIFTPNLDQPCEKAIIEQNRY